MYKFANIAINVEFLHNERTVYICEMSVFDFFMKQ